MSMQRSMYHIILRVSALSLAFLLLFESGLLSPVTKELSQGTHSYLASAIGMNASVMPTDINTLTAQLTQRERALSEREIAVSLREDSGTSSDVPVFLLSIVLFILLTLIVLNYVLDYLRLRSSLESPHEQTV